MKLEGKMGRARFSKAEWFEPLQSLNPLVIGAGGIGSWLGHFLARAGAVPIVYDMDRYDANNIGGQLCKIKDIGENKAIALQKIISDMLGPFIMTGVEEEYTEDSAAYAYTLCAVDNMNVRKLAYEKWLSLGDERELFIDGRMGAELFQVYTATKTKDEYMSHWFPPEEAIGLPCAYKATSHIGSMTASVMVNILTNYLGNSVVPSKVSYLGQLLEMEIQ